MSIAFAFRSQKINISAYFCYWVKLHYDYSVSFRKVENQIKFLTAAQNYYNLSAFI